MYNISSSWSDYFEFLSSFFLLYAQKIEIALKSEIEKKGKINLYAEKR